jgi:HK97 gp10 family phage protein
MTFTNKAALEMKSRIVKALDELSYPEYYKERSHAYAALLSSELSIPTHEIHIRSRKILHHILHRYEDFFVLTIDKFNLKLIRSFSRDLDLPNDFEVILNEKEVIEQVVDLLLDQLGDEQKNALTNLVFEYAKNNLDDGEKWNFRDQLIEFGTILSNEKDQQSGYVNPTDAVIAVVSVKRSAVSLANEFGTSKMSARPFLRPALDSNAETVLGVLKGKLAEIIPAYALKLSKRRKK